MRKKLKHVISIKQFDLELINYIYQLTNCIRQFDKSKEGLLHLKNLLCDKRAMLYFTQTSTRTFLSFQSACHIVGLQTSEIRDPSTSSEIKGESTEDSLRTFSSYVDLIIMRSPISGLSEKTAEALDKTPRPIPIINAGSGSDEHPTQAILDIYTLMRWFKGSENINNKTVCFVGDLKRGRTVRSLARILCLFQNVKMIFVSPPQYKMGDDLRQFLTKKGISFEETTNFKNSIQACDAIYMTRIQDEWNKQGEQNENIEDFCLKKDHLKMIGDQCIIMHPLPRREELDPLIDKDPRAMYWRQERNGMWTRVALITMLMGVDDKISLPSL